MRTVHRDLAVALALELALLAGLSALTPVSGFGSAVALLVVASAAALLIRGLWRAGARSLGPANRVTLLRATLVAAVAALVVTAAPHSAPGPLIAVAACGALALDAVDGRVARRTGSVSDLGARFDMEVDAVLILVLSIDVVPIVGGWVLAVGLARYALGAAALTLPWLRRPVPPSRWRKAVAAVQGVALTLVAAGLLPIPVAVLLLTGAGLLLAQSFLSQVWWLARHARGAASAGVVVSAEARRA